MSTPPEEKHVVHAPAPAATPSDRHEIHIARVGAPKVTARLTTVHNWVQLIYEAFGFPLPVAATEIAILGVRESSLQGKPQKVKGKPPVTEDRVDVLESQANERAATKVRFTRETRKDDLLSAVYNDLIFVTYTKNTPELQQGVDVFECTIDPDFAEDEAPGTGLLLEGKRYHGYPGKHGTYDPKDTRPADCLHLYKDSAGSILVARDFTKQHTIFDKLESATAGDGNKCNFCRLETNDSFHMHFGQASGFVARWSSGCTVLRHPYYDLGDKVSLVSNSGRYQRFIDLFTQAKNKKVIPYLVVSSRYVRSYEEWVKYIEKNPKLLNPTLRFETVIKKDCLRSPKGMDGKYIPSFMTDAFVKAVLEHADKLERANETDTDKVYAKNLRESLDRALFTLAKDKSAGAQKR